MPTISPQTKEVRDHILHKTRISRNGLSPTQIYLRNNSSRTNRRNQIKSDSSKTEFFLWIDEIQQKLGLTIDDFAQALFLSTQTIYLWKRRSGVYPSQKSFRRLKQLERQTRFVIRDLQTTIRIRS